MGKRVYHHYSEWEDWKAGMYRTVPAALFEDMQGKAADLLASPSGLYLHMQAVATGWTRATEVVFTNPSRNHRAWLGQAACCHHCGAPEYVTKAAWRTLRPIQQWKANDIADIVIADWRAGRTLNA